MKPVAFNYARPATVAEALGMLAGNPEAKVLAGGQTLGPMLNLRLAQPTLLIDITRIPELAAVREDEAGVSIGATVTHAAIEDGRIADPTRGFLARVARGIAYRAVRTRGTIGGSLANADPAADWLCCLSALGAEVVVMGAGGSRSAPLAGFARGAMATALVDEELLAAVRVPRYAPAVRFGFHKICRKTGEFADAIGAAMHDPDRRTTRLAASTSAGPPIVIEALDLSHGALPDAADIERRLVAAGLAGDAYDVRLRAVAVRRALAEAATP
jgi:carbon-monoxide dehydrogenase medium subunit